MSASPNHQTENVLQEVIDELEEDFIISYAMECRVMAEWLIGSKYYDKSTEESTWQSMPKLLTHRSSSTLLRRWKNMILPNLPKMFTAMPPGVRAFFAAECLKC